MRTTILILSLVLAGGTDAVAQAAATPSPGDTAPALPQTSRHKTVVAAPMAPREAERAAALERGRRRFFQQVIGFDHETDDPLATHAITGLPTEIKLPKRRH